MPKEENISMEEAVRLGWEFEILRQRRRLKIDLDDYTITDEMLETIQAPAKTVLTSAERPVRDISETFPLISMESCSLSRRFNAFVCSLVGVHSLSQRPPVSEHRE